MVGVIDYKAGNIQSVSHALAALRIEHRIGGTPADLQDSECLIFPGVGNAAYAMRQIKKTGFDSFLKDKTAEGIPLLGICLGSQIIFDYSEEGDTECLGLLKGRIEHFTNIGGFNGCLKIPHMGWNDISYSTSACPLFTDIKEHSDFYFVHSYVIRPEKESIVCAYTDYGIRVPAAVHSGCIFACQFHPEKSGETGLRILHNFVSHCSYAGKI